MALNAAVVWEVRTTGSDSNAGGFKAGAAGTDYSQQDAAQDSGTGLVIDGADATKVTPDGHTVEAADVGNLINITAGTGFTPGFYEITAQDGTQWTLDRAAGTLGSTGGTWALGGALLTIGAALTPLVGGNDVWVKTGTYAITTGLSMTVAGTPADPTRLLGYGTTRGDGGRPTISTESAITVLTLSAVYQVVEGLIISGLSGTTRSGFSLTTTRQILRNCKISGCGASGSYAGISGGGLTLVEFCEVGPNASGTGSAGINVNSTSFIVRGCYIHDLAGPGITTSANGLYIFDTIVDGCAGASSDGIYFQAGGGQYFHTVDRCVLYNNGRDGVRFASAVAMGTVTNSLFVNNAGVGLNHLDVVDNMYRVDYNAFYGNGTIRAGFAAGANDVTLTGDPFTDAANADFTLNDTAGAGAACKGAGWPGTLPGL